MGSFKLYKYYFYQSKFELKCTMQLLAATFLVLFTIGNAQDATYEWTCVSGSEDTDRVDCSKTVTGEADNATALAAAQAAAMCNYPDNSVTDNAYTTYGCDACADDAEGTCVECAAYDDGDNSNCNTYVAPTISWTRMVDVNETTCTGTTIECFGAAEGYTGDETTLINGGCGSCATAGFTEDCDDCTTDMCNGAGRVFALMAPLLAALFWLH